MTAHFLSKSTRLTALAGALFTVFLFTGVPAAAAGPVVTVTGGQLEGKTLAVPGGAVFKGIPFAQAPVGDLRWREPQAVKAWTGIRQAAEYGAACAQSDSGWNNNSATTSSEDCLFLNVWTPQWPAQAKKPVMFWVHGGGNAGGSALGAGGIEPPFDGASLAAHGVIVVTINYRLGLFGFIGHPELTAESPHHASGAYGLLDIIAAMKWVHDNIGRFGGDADNVTVFGQSAGSQNLSILLTSPLIQGLFQKVILESGTPMISDKRLQTPAQMEQLGVALAQATKAPASGAIQYMRKLPTSEILAANSDFRKNLNGLILDVGMDGYVVPKFSPDVYRSGKEAPVTMIIGNNAHEGGGGRGGPAGRSPEDALKAQIENGYQKYPDLQEKLMKIYGLNGGSSQAAADLSHAYGPAAVQLGTDEQFRCEAVTLAGWHSSIAPTYEYEFTGETDDHPALHSGELAFVFGVLPDWAADAKFHKLSDAMEEYWTSFARTGVPAAPGLPKWQRLDAKTRQYMEFSNEGPLPKEALRSATCAVYTEKLSRDIDARK